MLKSLDDYIDGYGVLNLKTITQSINNAVEDQTDCFGLNYKEWEDLLVETVAELQPINSYQLAWIENLKGVARMDFALDALWKGSPEIQRIVELVADDWIEDQLGFYLAGDMTKQEIDLLTIKLNRFIK